MWDYSKKCCSNCQLFSLPLGAASSKGECLEKGKEVRASEVCSGDEDSFIPIPEYMAPQDNDSYRLYLFYADDSREEFGPTADVEELVIKAKGFSESVGAKIGTLTRMIITDSGDYTIFEWTTKEGVVFPKTN